MKLEGAKFKMEGREMLNNLPGRYSSIPSPKEIIKPIMSIKKSCFVHEPSFVASLSMRT